jgi:hypothetical protein
MYVFLEGFRTWLKRALSRAVCALATQVMCLLPVGMLLPAIDFTDRPGPDQGIVFNAVRCAKYIERRTCLGRYAHGKRFDTYM